MQMEQLKEFVCLENRKRELEAEVKRISQTLDDLEEALVPQFLEDGVSSMKVDGRTVYIAQDVYASPVNDRTEVVDALKASELGQYVAENYNTNSLKSFVREIADEVRLRCEQQDQMFTEAEVQAALPAALAAVLRVSFKHSLRSRKA